MYWRRQDLPRIQNTTSVANAFFRVQESFFEQLLELLLEPLLLRKLSAAGAFSAKAGPGRRFIGRTASLKSRLLLALCKW